MGGLERVKLVLTIDHDFSGVSWPLRIYLHKRTIIKERRREIK